MPGLRWGLRWAHLTKIRFPMASSAPRKKMKIQHLGSCSGDRGPCHCVKSKHGGENPNPKGGHMAKKPKKIKIKKPRRDTDTGRNEEPVSVNLTTAWDSAHAAIHIVDPFFSFLLPKRIVARMEDDCALDRIHLANEALRHEDNAASRSKIFCSFNLRIFHVNLLFGNIFYFSWVLSFQRNFRLTFTVTEPARGTWDQQWTSSSRFSWILSVLVIYSNHQGLKCW